LSACLARYSRMRRAAYQVVFAEAPGFKPTAIVL